MIKAENYCIECGKKLSTIFCNDVPIGIEEGWAVERTDIIDNDINTQIVGFMCDKCNRVGT